MSPASCEYKRTLVRRARKPRYLKTFRLSGTAQRTTRIACLSWGSLIWKPESFLIDKPWFTDAPEGRRVRLQLVLETIAVQAPLSLSIKWTENRRAGQGYR